MAGKISELDPITGAALTLADDIEVRDIDDPEMSPLTGTNHALPLGELILFLQAHMADAGLVVDDVPPADTSVLWADTTEQGWASNTVLAGTVAPTSGDGNDGDFWINTTTWMIYGPRDDAVWPTGVSMTGGGGGGGLDQATADTLYVNLTGDTMPGNLVLSNASTWHDLGANNTNLIVGPIAGDHLLISHAGIQGEHGATDTAADMFIQEYGGRVFVNGKVYLTEGDPVDSDQAATKNYVDLHINDTTAAHAASAISGLGALATKSTIASADITDNTVANNDLATMPANTFKGNNTAGVAAPTDVTVAAMQAALSVVTPTGTVTLSGKTISMGNNTVSGTSSEFNLANLDADFYTTGGTDVAVADGGTGRSTATTAYGLIAAGTTATGAQQTVTPAASGFLKTTSTTALPAWAAIASGDVSGLGSLATLSTVGAAQITDGVVSNTELSTMPASTIKGNNTGSTAAPIDMTVAQAKTLLALVKGDVGLANVDNTSDANKPVSTAQQTALNLKVDKTSLTVASTAPSSPAVNDLWVDTT